MIGECEGKDISIALQYYLEAEIQRRNMPDPIAPADFFNMLISAGTYTDRDFLRRIAQVAYERYTARHIDGDVPTLAIVPSPLTEKQASDLLGGRLNYVMIFGAESIYFQDTVHALAVDSHHSGGVNVLGAHIDWVSPGGGSIKRALVMDETGLVKEFAFEKPVPIHIVQILHLPMKGEQQIHRELSRSFRDRGIPQINPYEDSSERADDKTRTHALWEQYGHGIVSPRYVLIKQNNSPKEILEQLKSFIDAPIEEMEVVVQPNKGTEGYKVENFIISQTLNNPPPSQPSPIEGEGVKVGQKPELLSVYNQPTAGFTKVVKYIKDEVLPEDDAIVRERRGNVKYLEKGDSNVLLNVTFRINVAWNGSEFVAESGYAQVAKDEGTFPASRGRGGSIVNINEALANLYCHNGERWIRLIPTDKDIEEMKAAAIKAAYGLNAGLDAKNYLKLMGIDILLEAEGLGENIISVVLEANPRPAGLSHSSEIVGISDKQPQPTVSTEIFRSLADLDVYWKSSRPFSKMTNDV